MTSFFSMWKKPEAIPTKSPAEMTSQFLYKSNEIFKIFLNNCSWFVYFIAGLLILCCIYYYVYDCKRRMEHRRRRDDVQRANERHPQRRRPGAVYRDHEIFRNAIKTVRQYMGPKQTPYVLKRTRSGAIYGRYTERENAKG